MENLGFILVFVLVITNGVLVWFLFKRGEETKKPDTDDAGLKFLHQQMNDLSRTVHHVNETVNTKISESSKQMTEQLLNVAKSMTESNETGKQVLTIADQLRNLEKVLKHQKQRGNLGEASLELILSNILPPTAYKSQYEFSDGDTVDAAIITKEGLIPVDAKFSLDNYNRIINEEDPVRRLEIEKEFKNDLKKRIDETAKYIRPSEGTLPLAFMFIPAEGIYYDLLVNEVGAVKVNTRSLIDYAYNDKKVIIVSPTTFSAYLQTVLHGLQRFKIAEDAKEIIKRVEDLGKHLGAYEQFMTSLGNSLGTTVNHYNKAHKEFQKIDKDVLRISGSAAGVEPLVLSKPERVESE